MYFTLVLSKNPQVILYGVVRKAKEEKSKGEKLLGNLFPDYWLS